MHLVCKYDCFHWLMSKRPCRKQIITLHQFDLAGMGKRVVFERFDTNISFEKFYCNAVQFSFHQKPFVRFFYDEKQFFFCFSGVIDSFRHFIGH